MTDLRGRDILDLLRHVERRFPDVDAQMTALLSAVAIIAHANDVTAEQLRAGVEQSYRNLTERAQRQAERMHS